MLNLKLFVISILYKYDYNTYADLAAALGTKFQFYTSTIHNSGVSEILQGT